jgi:hypothetical protein
MGDVIGKHMTDRPSIKDRPDPLPEVFGSLGIQEAIL